MEGARQQHVKQHMDFEMFSSRFSYKQRVQKKSTMRFFPLYIYLLRSMLLEQNIVFEMSSKYEVIY